MKSTGIVRRIDDLGRIVIPKGIRRTLRVKEGDPLELFVNGEGICFMRHQRFDDAAWEKAKRMLSAVIPAFAILDEYGDCVKAFGIDVANEQEAQKREDISVYHIKEYEDSLAYLVVKKDSDSEKVSVAVNILKSYLEMY